MKRQLIGVARCIQRTHRSWRKMQEEEHGFRGEDQADKLLVNTARVTSYEMQFACDRDSRGKPMARCNARIPRHLVWNQTWTGFHRIRGHGSASETDPLSIILDHRNWYVSSLKRSRRKKALPVDVPRPYPNVSSMNTESNYLEYKCCAFSSWIYASIWTNNAPASCWTRQGKVMKDALQRRELNSLFRMPLRLGARGLFD